MSSEVHGLAQDQPIDALIVGHVTRDLVADGSWRPGGAALYAGVAARRLGLRVGIVTSAPEDVCARARKALGDTPLVVVETAQATTFENVYTPAGRVQYLRAVARPLTVEDIPAAWQGCALALLAPVAGEFAPTLAADLPHVRIIGAAPQGWMRQRGDDGRISPRALTADEVAALGALSALMLSREDLTGPGADSVAEQAADGTLAQWARLVPLITVTRGAEGADLWRDGVARRFPGYPAHEADPTGAGDIFAATFLCALAAGSDPAAAMDQANRVAALSVEGIGPDAIPTLAQVAARYPHSS